MRIEEDFLGEVRVPEEAYYGSFTARALANFAISGQKVDMRIIRAVALIKKAAAMANLELGKLDKKAAKAIITAADEVIGGMLDNQFVLDALQAGAGTPLHMNVNEVIANRAEEILGGRRGEYRMVHPNNHVNMSQSSNDVVPSSIRIASIRSGEAVVRSARALSRELSSKSKEYSKTLKIGRTHLQDAVPMTYGQTFAAWAGAVEKDALSIESALESVRELGIGGTATGSGINAHPKFRQMVVANISKEGRIKVRAAPDAVQTTQSMNDFLLLSSALRQYAVTLGRIAGDIRLLVSGPKGGLGELLIPEVEPGSSIMPGKVNPSVPEAVNMLSYQVIANDMAVCLGAQSGQLELNFATPLIGHNLMQSLTLLENGTDMFVRECVRGLKVDAGRTRENLERSFGYATALTPYLGYKQVSALVREALEKNVSLRELILKKGIMGREDLEKVIASATGPSEVDKEILKRVKIKP